MKEIFEINAAGIDTERLKREIEEQVNARGYDPAEVERIRNLSFTPVSPAGGRGFDPAITSELFELPVATPDFQSRKFRYLKGPLKWLAGRLFRALVQINDKLSENKIQAFYNVVHELIAINYRYDKLQSRFETVLEENLKLRGRLEELNAARGMQLPSAENIPQLEPARARRNARLIERIQQELKPEERTSALCLDDAWGHYAFEMQNMGFLDVSLNVADPLQRQYIKIVRGLEARLASADACLAACPDQSLSLLTVMDLAGMTGIPDEIPGLAAKKLKPGGYIMLVADGARLDSPFSRNPVWRIDAEKLQELFEAFGFSPVIMQDEESSDGGFALILKKNR